MTTTRQQISRIIAERGEAKDYTPPAMQDISEIFGKHVFNDEVMRTRLPKSVYKALKNTIKGNKPLDPAISEIVAATMKDWASELGATHFTHWFQPLTGATAEKHDSFLIPDGDDQAIMRFSGGELTQGEPDASSFPSGGIRATFEARGYTAWDPSSPAFVKLNAQGGTLCIPTAFCSYTGEALDKKTPILRSEAAITKSATRLLNLMGEKDVTNVYSTVGLEQEYFLVDMEYYNSRPDMIATGRTLFGAAPFKGQSLDDHYFGAIKPRILSFMQDTEQALFKLGVPVRTRHNEVAPAQFEVAPVYEKSNIAVDHNMMVMEVMKEIAAKHKLMYLVHEKPFAGLNGSGKHCNWSLSDNLGNNLLEPGSTPHQNANFLIVLTAIIRGIDKYAKLLRLSVAHAGNDHRLGANEAPPAIISAFLGAELGQIVEDLCSGDATSSTSAAKIKLGSSVLPELPKDSTDRNRTSPFAFTGNKFEFRALGASQHVGGPVFFINTIVADSLDYMSDEIEAKVKGGMNLSEAADAVVKATLKQHQRVIFNGDGYAQEWQDEAEKRGLYNLKTTPEAAEKMMDADVADLFGRYNILTPNEIESRYNIKLEAYILGLEIEFSATADIARTMILPAAIEHQNNLATAVASSKALGLATSAQEVLMKKVNANVEALTSKIDAFNTALAAAPHEDALKHCHYFKDTMIPMMDGIRVVADALELQVDDRLWPLVKYREMLFLS